MQGRRIYFDVLDLFDSYGAVQRKFSGAHGEEKGKDEDRGYFREKTMMHQTRKWGCGPNK